MRVSSWTSLSAIGSITVFALIYGLASDGDISAACQEITEIDWHPRRLALIALTSGLVLLLRSLRLTVFVPILKLSSAVKICATHNALTRIMPLRTGELSLPLMLRRDCGVELSEGGLLMLWLRGLEAASLVPFTLICLYLSDLVSPPSGLYNDQLVWLRSEWLALLAMISIVLLWGIRPLSRLCFRLIGRGLHLVGREELSIKAKSLISLDRQTSPAQTFFGTLITLMILSAQAYLFWLILKLSGAQVTLGTVAVGSIGVHLAGVIPAPTIGNVGTHELGWSLIFTALGVKRSIALSSAVLSQWLTLGLAICWWLIVRGHSKCERRREVA